MAGREPYRTKARTEMMRYLEENRLRTVSAEDILQDLQKSGLRISATTVYRNLEKLCQEHIVMKFVAEKGEKAVYQLEHAEKQCKEHLHLKCLKCGTVIHMDCGFMEEVESHLKEGHGFTLQCEGSVLYGVCDTRAKQNNEEEKQKETGLHFKKNPV